MDGKVIVVTGASGALGRVVAEVAVARGARVAGLDHAPTQTPAADNRIEIGGVDLSLPVGLVVPAVLYVVLMGRRKRVAR